MVHAGTLDPLATGILPIAFGNATKTIPYLVSSKKKYRFSILWGVRTSTHDLEGEIIEENNFVPTKKIFSKNISNFKGEFYQRPPKYSAVKIMDKEHIILREVVLILILKKRK